MPILDDLEKIAAWYYDVAPVVPGAKKKDKRVSYPYMQAYGSPQITSMGSLGTAPEEGLTILDFRKERHLFCETPNGDIFTVQVPDSKDRVQSEISSKELIAEEATLAKQIEKDGFIRVYNSAIPDDDDEISGSITGPIMTAISMGNVESSMTFSPQGRKLRSHSSSEISESSESSASEAGGNILETHEIPVARVYTEAQLLEQHHIKYVRYPTANGVTPDPKEVDEFIKGAINGFGNIWGHCHGGNSRTAMTMAMYDYIYLAMNTNAQQEKDRCIEEGVCKDPWQHAKIVKPTPEKVKKNPRSLEKWQKRNEFLEKFKQYIDSIKDENSPTKFKENYKPWSEWLRDGDSKTRSAHI